MLTLHAYAQAPPIGNWRVHHSYAGTIEVVKGDKIYTATSQAIFSTNNTGQFEYYNKLTGLAEASIANICWDNETEQLVVAYTNNNIDVIKGGLVKNIYDLVRTSRIQKINSIYCEKGLAYVNTKIGIVVIDLLKYEIKESWVLGSNGNTLEVFSLTKGTNNWYAATQNGIYTASVSNLNIADAKSWTNIYPAVNDKPVKKLSSTPSGLIIEKNDSLILIQPAATSALFFKASEQIKSWQFYEQKITIATTDKQTSKARVHQLTIGNATALVFEQPALLINPNACIFSNGTIWISDEVTGLIKLDPSSSSFIKIIPDGPGGQISTALLATSTGILAASNAKKGLMVLENGKWQPQNGLDSVTGVQSIAINHLDNSIWLSTAQMGVAKWQNNKVQLFNPRNSSLIGTINNTCFTTGVKADSKGNTWVSNTGTTISLHVYQADGKWTGFANPFGITDAGTLEIDDAGQIWCVTKNANGLLVYNPGNSFTSSADDKWKQYKAGTGAGNLPSNQINCTAKDKNGFIWVGTDRGIGIIQCIENIFTPASCDALLPVVQQDRMR
jgi:ligand-binding sensor domain-containing protein